MQKSILEIVNQAKRLGMSTFHEKEFANFVAARFPVAQPALPGPKWLPMEPLSSDWAALESTRSVLLSHDIGEMEPVKAVRRRIIEFLRDSLGTYVPKWVLESELALIPWTLVGTPSNYVQQFFALINPGWSGDTVKIPYFDRARLRSFTFNARPTSLVKQLMAVSKEIAKSFGVSLESATSTVISGVPCLAPSIQLACGVAEGQSSNSLLLAVKDGLKAEDWHQLGLNINFILGRSERRRARDRGTLRKMEWSAPDQAEFVSRSRHPVERSIYSFKSSVVQDQIRSLRFRAKSLFFPRIGPEAESLLANFAGEESDIHQYRRLVMDAYVEYLDRFFASLTPSTSYAELTKLEWSAMDEIGPWIAAIENAITPGLGQAMYLASVALEHGDYSHYERAIEVSPFFRALAVAGWQDNCYMFCAFATDYAEEFEMWGPEMWTPAADS